MPSRRLLLAAGAAALAAPPIRTARAQAPVRFVLDWALQGNHGMFALAEDRGIDPDTIRWDEPRWDAARKSFS